MRDGVRTICFTKSRKTRRTGLPVHGRPAREPPTPAWPSASRRTGPATRPRSAAASSSVSSAANCWPWSRPTRSSWASTSAPWTPSSPSGYPGTVASLWQQWGRAGRGKGESLGVFVAGNDALEQFFIRHPDELLDRPVEAATIDFTNPYIHGRHLVAAAYEAPLTLDDDGYFGPGLAAAADKVVRRRPAACAAASTAGSSPATATRRPTSTCAPRRPTSSPSSTRRRATSWAARRPRPPSAPCIPARSTSTWARASW